MYSIHNEDYHDNGYMEFTQTPSNPLTYNGQNTVPDSWNTVQYQNSNRSTSSALFDYSNTARSSNPHPEPPNPLAYGVSWSTAVPAQNSKPSKPLPSISSIFSNSTQYNVQGHVDVAAPNGQIGNTEATTEHRPSEWRPVGSSMNGVLTNYDGIESDFMDAVSSTQVLDTAPSSRETLQYQNSMPISSSFLASEYDHMDHMGTQDPTMPFPAQYDYTVPANHMEAQDPSTAFPAQYDHAVLSNLGAHMGSQDPSTAFPVTNAPVESAVSSPNRLSLVQYQSKVPSSTTESVICAPPSMDFATTPYPDTSNASTDTTKRVCSNCFTTDTYHWRGVRSKTEILCATCNHYQYKYKKPRPPMPRPRAELPKVCTRCSKTESSRWLFDHSRTALICRSCHRQECIYGTDRPLTKRLTVAELEKICEKCSKTEASRWFYNKTKTGVVCNVCHVRQLRMKTQQNGIN